MRLTKNQMRIVSLVPFAVLGTVGGSFEMELLPMVLLYVGVAGPMWLIMYSAGVFTD
jgi:hypothetical protein